MILIYNLIQLNITGIVGISYNFTSWKLSSPDNFCPPLFTTRLKFFAPPSPLDQKSLSAKNTHKT